MKNNLDTSAEIIQFNPNGLFFACNDNNYFVSDAELNKLGIKISRVKKKCEKFLTHIIGIEEALEDLERVSQWVLSCRGGHILPERKLFNEGVKIVDIAMAIILECGRIRCVR